MTVTVRFVDNWKNINHRCIAFKLYQHSFNMGNLYVFLVEILQLADPNRRERVITWAKDGAKVNSSVSNQLAGSFLQNGIGTTCWSHSVNVVGEVFLQACQNANKVIQMWSSLASTSKPIRNEFLKLCKEAIVKNSEVRWYQWYRVGKQIFFMIGPIMNILRDETMGSEKKRPKLLELIENNYVSILLELALIVDVCEIYEKSCVVLEGDGFIAPLVYDIWNHLRTVGRDIVNGIKENNLLAEFLPNVAYMYNELIADEISKRQMFYSTVEKYILVYDKLDSESN